MFAVIIEINIEMTTYNTNVVKFKHKFSLNPAAGMIHDSTDNWSEKPPAWYVSWSLIFNNQI